MGIKKNNLLVSVLVVNFNNAQYIEQCINSLLKQKYKYVEIIVIDDQSTDNSIEILMVKWNMSDWMKLMN